MNEKTRKGLEEFISVVGLTVVSYTVGYTVGWVITEGYEKLKILRQFNKSYRNIKQVTNIYGIEYTRKQFKEDIEKYRSSDSKDEWIDQWIEEIGS